MTPPLPVGSDTTRSGAALIEASLVVALMCLVLFGVMQVSRIYAAREVIDYASMSGARARAVGLNSFMVEKVVRVAAIPNAGRMVIPDEDAFMDSAEHRGSRQRPGEMWEEAVAATPGMPLRSVLERQRIPFYLGGENHAQLGAILDYENWRTVSQQVSYHGEDEISVRVNQRFPLSFPLRRAFAAGDEALLRASAGGARMTDHSALYLE